MVKFSAIAPTDPDDIWGRLNCEKGKCETGHEVGHGSGPSTGRVGYSAGARVGGPRVQLRGPVFNEEKGLGYWGGVSFLTEGLGRGQGQCPSPEI